MNLNRFLNVSALNLLALLDSAKQGDGKYAYKITGTLGPPFPLPDPK